MKRFWIITGLFFFVTMLFAQSESVDIRSGNKYYKKEKFSEAEIEYRKALQKNAESFEANYNLGNALFKQGKYEQAMEFYQAAFPFANDKQKKAFDYHNIGNTLMGNEKYKEAIEAYKMSLRNNPKDDETRYNLAYAQAMLKKEEDNNDGGGGASDNQDNKEDEPKKQPDNQPDNQQEQPQPQQQQMSKEQAQQILEALEQDEKDIQDKVRNKQQRSIKKTDKDW